MKSSSGQLLNGQRNRQEYTEATMNPALNGNIKKLQIIVKCSKWFAYKKFASLYSMHTVQIDATHFLSKLSGGGKKKKPFFLFCGGPF